MMPFELCNGPSIFQRILMDIFHDILCHFLEVLIDKFGIINKRHKHIDHLKLTFEKCREAKLALNPTKCFIGMENKVILGY
jgi:hypothetical protein